MLRKPGTDTDFRRRLPEIGCLSQGLPHGIRCAQPSPQEGFSTRKARELRVNFVQGLKCLSCETVYPMRVGNTCPRCGITGILDVQYDYAAIGRILTRRRLAARTDQSHWRYRELLPVGSNAVLPALFVGGTPLTATPALARYLGMAKLFLKDDGRNATGSLKDRASSVGVVRAREKRRPIVACASTGNAAS